MASGDTIFNDTFTEASDTALTSHTPNTGTGWTEVDARGTARMQVTASVDRLQPDSDQLSDGQTVTADATYPSADYQVQTTFTQVSSTVDEFVQLYARYTAQANNGYYSARISSHVGNDPSIYRATGATTESIINTIRHDNSAFAWYSDGDVIMLEVIGSDIAVFGGFSGEEIARSYVSDINVTAAGKAGLGFGAYWANSGGDTAVAQQDVDNFNVYEVGDTVTGWNSPSTTGETDNQFTNPTNAYSSNDIDMTVNGDNGLPQAQDFGDFGFSLDSGDTVRGITVRVEHASDASGWMEVGISVSNDNGASWSTEKTARLEDYSSDGFVLFGHARSLWGLTWTPSDLNDTNFRVRIRITARENVNVDTVYFDHISVRVVSDAASSLSINVSENITVTDTVIDVVRDESRDVNVSENITVTESYTVSPEISDLSISVSELITVTESVTALLIHLVSVSDSISLSESVGLLITSLISVNDSISITENTSLDTSDPQVDGIIDSVSIAESVAISLESFVDVSDSISATESTSLSLVSLISISDSISVAESVGLLLEALVEVSDSTSITENISTRVSDPHVSVNDFISVTESISATVSYLFSVSDSISISESISLLLTSHISVNDTVSVVESVFSLITSFVDVNDSISVNENISISFGDIQVSTSDSISIAESVSLSISDLQVTVSDSVNVTESVGLVLISFVSVSDSISVAESVGITTAYSVSASDTISVTESVGALIESFINVSDSISVSENISTLLTSFIDISDSISIIESVSIITIYIFSTSDSISVSENISLNVLTYPVASDSISVSESVNLSAKWTIEFSDSISVSEGVSVALEASSVSASDSISVSESVGITIGWTIDVSDSILISESASLTLSNINLYTRDVLGDDIINPILVDNDLVFRVSNMIYI